MVNIVDNRMEDSCVFYTLNTGDFFIYNDELYEVCEVMNEHTGDTHQKALNVQDGNVIIDFDCDTEVQPVEVTITIERNL